MSSIPVYGASGDQYLAFQRERNEERKIRRGMRLDPKTWPHNTRRVLPPPLVRGALLLTGGFLLGWGTFRIWHD